MKHCVRFVNGPEGFFFDVPAQKHIPHEENVGNCCSIIGHGRTEVRFVGFQGRIWTDTSQIHEQVRNPKRVRVGVDAPHREVKGRLSGD